MLWGTAVRAWLRQPSHVDWLVAGSSLVLAVLSLWTTAVPLSHLGLAAASVAAVIQAIALLRRRRAPVVVLAVGTGVLVATTVLLGDPVSTEIGVLLMVYAVAVRRASRVTWGSVAAVLAVVTVTYALALQVPPSAAAPSWTTAALTQGLGFLVAVLVSVALGLTVRSRHLQLAILDERARQLVLERDQHAQLEVTVERERMAREMHDLVAHSVVVMVQLAHGASSAMDRDPAMARKALDELSRTGSEALDDMRRVLGILRDTQEGHVPGDASSSLPAEAVKALVATFKQVGLPVRLDVTGDPPASGDRLHHTTYRIVQESLTNVLRHAPGSTDVAVDLAWLADHVTITVTNTGGVPAARGSRSGGAGHGLRGLRERAAAHHGTVETGPIPDGWRVRATLHYAG